MAACEPLGVAVQLAKLPPVGAAGVPAIESGRVECDVLHFDAG